MMRKLAFAFLLAMSVLPAFAATEVVDGITWTYTVSDGKASVGSGHSYLQAVSQSMTGAIAIPSTLGNYPVTSIGDYAFSGCSGLTSITIPDSVTGIEWNAFEGCSGLRSITIPNSVTSIGDSAFEGCSGLTSIVIPDSVTSIEHYAFASCSGLVSITIPDGVTNIGDHAFAYCRGLTSIKIPDGVTNIGNFAFPGCSGLMSVTADPKWGTCFSSATNVSFTIPDGVTSIGDFAFSGCSGLSSITIPDSVTNIGSAAFSGCSGLSSITIPDSVTNIGSAAFSGCSDLSEIHISETTALEIKRSSSAYAYYGDFYFASGGYLTSAFPDSVVKEASCETNGWRWTCRWLEGNDWCEARGEPVDADWWSIDYQTELYYHSGRWSDIYEIFLEHAHALVVPSMVAGKRVVYFNIYPNSGWTSGIYGGEGYWLDRVELPTGLIDMAMLGIQARSGGHHFGFRTLPIQMPASMAESQLAVFDSSDQFHLQHYEKTQAFGGTVAFSTNEGTESTTRGKGVLWFGSDDCGGDIVIPTEIEGVTIENVGDASFRGNGNIRSLTSGNASIGQFAFQSCSNLLSASVGGNIAFGAFHDCPNLRDVSIAGDIGLYAFADCPALKSVSCQDATRLGGCAFRNCISLRTFDIPEGMQEFGYDVFSGCSNLETIRVPASVESLGYYSWGSIIGDGCTSLQMVQVDDGNGAFSSRDGCVFDKAGETLLYVPTGKTGVFKVPENVSNVGDFAFGRCSGLVSIIIPDSVTNVGEAAFSGCSGLTSVTIPGSVTNIGNSAFSGCSGLMSITIPDGVTNIGVYAFQNCTSLRSITIPGSVTNVGYNAFRGCSDLTSISIPESLADHIGSWSLPADCRRFIRPDIVTVDGVPIPGTWLDETARTFVATMEGDFEAAALATAANGVNKVWECYVAGLSPTNAAARFEARIDMVGGEPVVTWDPDLGVARDYVVEGKTNLVDRSWGPTNESTRFFRVKVELP